MSILMILVGCTTSDVISDAMESVSAEQSEFFINQSEAEQIAQEVLGRSSESRVGSTQDRPFIEIVKSNISRVGEDTPVAYIINYANNGGFVIIAADNRINPVLAYSYTGNFSNDNEIANTQFVNRIEDYISSVSESETMNGYNEILPTCNLVMGDTTALLNQWSPYNKYLDNTSCPAGCVAVATALQMLNSKRSFNYHGETFYCSSILNAYKNWSVSRSMSIDNEDPNLIVTPNPVYSLSTAQDKVAKLLYWIGKDVNMTYTTTGSSASSDSAYSVLKRIGFQPLTDMTYYGASSTATMTQHLKNKHTIYMEGQDWAGKTAHAWFINGIQYCETEHYPNSPQYHYFYCNWGWGGECNGFYSGDVFSVLGNNYSLYKFFAIKNEVSGSSSGGGLIIQ